MNQAAGFQVVRAVAEMGHAGQRRLPPRESARRVVGASFGAKFGVADGQEVALFYGVVHYGRLKSICINWLCGDKIKPLNKRGRFRRRQRRAAMQPGNVRPMSLSVGFECLLRVRQPQLRRAL